MSFKTRLSPLVHPRFLLRGFLYGGVVLLCVIGFWVLRPLPLASDSVDSRILPGMSLGAAIQRLNQDGVPVDPLLTKFWMRVVSGGRPIQAGTYTVFRGENLLDLLDKLKTGQVSRLELRFPEGWSLSQWLNYLSQQTTIKHTLEGRSEPEIAEILGIPERQLEGLFFPSTYRVDKGSSDVELLAQAYRVREARLNEHWAARAPDLPYRTPYEALVMASIIEKETGHPEDRERIAAVFVNRLRIGMRLQTDPSVIYGLGKAFDGNLRKADLNTDTPYNTYTRSGLPPTPIAMPGLASLNAALHPAKDDVLYFVARGDGRSVFSKTLDEHNEAVRRYQLKH